MPNIGKQRAYGGNKSLNAYGLGGLLCSHRARVAVFRLIVLAVAVLAVEKFSLRVAYVEAKPHPVFILEGIGIVDSPQDERIPNAIKGFYRFLPCGIDGNGDISPGAMS